MSDRCDAKKKIGNCEIDQFSDNKKYLKKDTKQTNKIHNSKITIMSEYTSNNHSPPPHSYDIPKKGRGRHGVDHK
jgi:hypothetical protein